MGTFQPRPWRGVRSLTLASFSWLSRLLTSLENRSDFVSEEDKLLDMDSTSD